VFTGIIGKKQQILVWVFGGRTLRQYADGMVAVRGRPAVNGRAVGIADR